VFGGHVDFGELVGSWIVGSWGTGDTFISRPYDSRITPVCVIFL
jgi:hypothetical protein